MSKNLSKKISSLLCSTVFLSSIVGSSFVSAVKDNPTRSNCPNVPQRAETTRSRRLLLTQRQQQYVRNNFLGILRNISETGTQTDPITHLRTRIPISRRYLLAAGEQHEMQKRFCENLDDCCESTGSICTNAQQGNVNPVGTKVSLSRRYLLAPGEQYEMQKRFCESLNDCFEPTDRVFSDAPTKDLPTRRIYPKTTTQVYLRAQRKALPIVKKRPGTTTQICSGAPRKSTPIVKKCRETTTQVSSGVPQKTVPTKRIFGTKVISTELLTSYQNINRRFVSLFQRLCVKHGFVTRVSLKYANGYNDVFSPLREILGIIIENHEMSTLPDFVEFAHYIENLLEHFNPEQMSEYDLNRFIVLVNGWLTGFAARI